MFPASIAAVPGLGRQTQGFLWQLADIAARNGWNVDGLAAIISHESGFSPSIRNPASSSTGLIQFIESTARRLGTSTAELARMTAEEQLPYVEKFYRMTLQGRTPAAPEDYILAPYGRPDLEGMPDDYIVDRRDGDTPAERERYRVNAGLDTDHNGAITVGDLRRSLRATLAAARGQRVAVPRAAPSSPRASSDDGVLLALGALAVWFALRARAGAPPNRRRSIRARNRVR